MVNKGLILIPEQFLTPSFEYFKICLYSLSVMEFLDLPSFDISVTEWKFRGKT